MNTVTFTAAIGLAAVSPLASASLPAPFAEKDDPARWYTPVETSQAKYENAMREARNALAEALRDCRASGGTRASCKAEARARYHDDVAHAKDYLAPRRQLA